MNSQDPSDPNPPDGSPQQPAADADMSDRPTTPPRPDRGPGSTSQDRSRRNARLVLGLALIGLTVMVGASVGVVVLAREGMGAKVEDHAFLEVVIEPGLSDAPGDAGLVMNPEDFPPLITEMAAGIRNAITDERVSGLYLEINGVDLGMGGVQELRDAVSDFVAGGKPCYAYAEALDNKSYYLASACDQIYLPPGGVFMVTGLEVTTEYYAGLLDKVGVLPDMEHVGDFKSAVEPFERDGPSDAASLATEALLDGLYGQLVAGIAEGRELSVEAVTALVDSPPITPDAALAAGLIDGLKYRDEVAEGICGEDRTEIGALISDAGGFPTGPAIAVVHAEGSIVSGESGSPLFGGSMVGDRSFAEFFEEIRENDDVLGVVLRVNSPGGSGLASDMMWREVERTQAAGKPVVVSMGDYAASGGYYIAAGADWIVAQPGTLTGSIGVFGGKMSLGGTYEKLGIKTHTWQRGSMANIFSSTSPFNDVERAKFREFLEGFYGTFLARVAEGRKLDREAVHAVAQGRVWTGEQALEHKLVDELGGIDAAVARLRTLISVEDGTDLRVVRFPRQKTLVDQILEDLGGPQSAHQIVVPELQAPLASLEVLSRVLERGGVAAMMPYTVLVR